MNIQGLTQPNKPLVTDAGIARDASVIKSTGAELKNGSTIQGTVVSITDTEGGKIANLSVGDSVISAKLQDGMGLREGQTLNFAVKSGGSLVSITPLYENTSVDQTTLRALTAAGIPINNDTVNMVKSMMEASLPIGKDALVQMSKNLSAFPNSSIATMVEMKSLNIPINNTNITQFESYKNYEHQVTSAMEDIMAELPEAFNALSESGNTKAALNLYGSVLKLFSEDPEPGTEVAAHLEGDLQQNADMAPLKEGDLQQNAATGQTPAGEGSLQTEQAPDGAKALNGEAGVQSSADPQTPKASAGSLNVLSDSFIETAKSLGISEESIDNYVSAQKAANLSAAAESDAGKALESAQKNLLKELAGAFESSDLNNLQESASWKKLFASDEYNKLLKDNITSQWLLKPTDVEKKENIDNLYQRLGSQIKELTNAITQNLGAENKLSQTANNLQNNLDFMNQLNQMFQYVQLPLQMTGQNVHGDLFVYKNKHKKVSEDGSVSAVLHLDMENLGPLDCYVKMKDNRVSTNFYVADESVLDLINDNIHILNERLEKRGYTMNVRMALHDDKDSQDAAVDEMLEVARTPVMSVNSFDARA